MTNTPFTGGCQCGAIRFRTTELIGNAHICHCRMCQKAVGNYFAALVSTPKALLIWTRGTPSRFQSSADVQRGFCAQCGTPLFYDRPASSNIGLCIGSFDKPDTIKPLTQDGVEGRMPWFSGIAQIPDAGTTEAANDAELVEAVRRSNRQHPDHDTHEWHVKR